MKGLYGCFCPAHKSQGLQTDLYMFAYVRLCTFIIPCLECLETFVVEGYQ